MNKMLVKSEIPYLPNPIAGTTVHLDPGEEYDRKWSQVYEKDGRKYVITYAQIGYGDFADIWPVECFEEI